MSEEEQVPAELVAGKYKLTRLLGRGGMGSVWEGVHQSLSTRVAVKFIESEFASSPEAMSRFENEARAAATLQSKHVVQVYDHGLMDDGRPYIVMEFLAGEPLDKRLERLGVLEPRQTALLMGQVCRALTKAHANGIVHRDLKPENVFLVWDDDDGADIAKVVDFGIAKFTNADLGLSSATRTGSVLGTPYYMSPEQARGLRDVDHRSDLWSLAVITYICVVGQLPFDGEAVGDLLVKICTSPIPVPSQARPGLPPLFDEWFARALQREPNARFQSAQELADALYTAVGLEGGAPVASMYRPPMGSAADGTLVSAGGVAADASGAFHAPSHAGSAVLGGSAGSLGQTAAPLTAAAAGVPKSNLPLVLGAAVLLGVLAVGGAGLVMMSGGMGAVSGAAGPEDSASAEAEGEGSPPPADDDSGDPEAPDPSASAAPDPAPSAAVPTPSPVTAPSPSPAPAAAAPAPAPRPVAARPVATPAPRPIPVAPKPRPKPKPAGVIGDGDTGY